MELEMEQSFYSIGIMNLHLFQEYNFVSKKTLH